MRSLSVRRTDARNDVDRNPSEKQKEAGNYKKGHFNFFGFQVTIENPKGSYRSGVDKNGKKWKTLMHNDYGYFTRTVGKDGDAIDVFLGPNLKSKKIFPIDQYSGNEFDETKVMLGFNSKEEARAAYLSNYEKGWKGLGYISEVDVDTFKKWLYDGYRQRKPFAKYKSLNESFRDIEDVYEEYSLRDLMDEFLDNKNHGITKKQWALIPKEQYQNLLKRFMNNPQLARIPKNIVQEWFEKIIIPNTLSIEYITIFAGHSSYFPSDELCDIFNIDEKGYDYWCNYLDKIGFYEWCVLPDGSDAWSDYGLNPIYKIINQYDSSMSAEEILVLINRVLDVYHQRGDLASAFIEGGSRSCYDISNSINESLNEEAYTEVHKLKSYGSVEKAELMASLMKKRGFETYAKNGDLMLYADRSYVDDLYSRDTYRMALDCLRSLESTRLVAESRVFGLSESRISSIICETINDFLYEKSNVF